MIELIGLLLYDDIVDLESQFKDDPALEDPAMKNRALKNLVLARVQNYVYQMA